jgi:hypothetical protein
VVDFWEPAESLADVFAAAESLLAEDDAVNLGSDVSLAELEVFVASLESLVLFASSPAEELVLFASSPLPDFEFEEAVSLPLEAPSADVSLLASDEVLVAATPPSLVVDVSLSATTSEVELVSAADVVEFPRFALEVNSAVEVAAASAEILDEVSTLDVSIADESSVLEAKAVDSVLEATAVNSVLETSAIDSVDDATGVLVSVILEDVELEISVVDDAAARAVSDETEVDAAIEDSTDDDDTRASVVVAAAISLDVLVSAAGRTTSEVVGATIGASVVDVKTDSGTVTGSTTGVDSTASAASEVGLGATTGDDSTAGVASGVGLGASFGASVVGAEATDFGWDMLASLNELDVMFSVHLPLELELAWRRPVVSFPWLGTRCYPLLALDCH